MENLKDEYKLKRSFSFQTIIENLQKGRKINSKDMIGFKILKRTGSLRA